MTHPVFIIEFEVRHSGYSSRKKRGALYMGAYQLPLLFQLLKLSLRGCTSSAMLAKAEQWIILLTYRYSRYPAAAGRQSFLQLAHLLLALGSAGSTFYHQPPQRRAVRLAIRFTRGN